MNKITLFLMTGLLLVTTATMPSNGSKVYYDDDHYGSDSEGSFFDAKPTVSQLYRECFPVDPCHSRTLSVPVLSPQEIAENAKREIFKEKKAIDNLCKRLKDGSATQRNGFFVDKSDALVDYYNKFIQEQPDKEFTAAKAIVNFIDKKYQPVHKK